MKTNPVWDKVSMRRSMSRDVVKDVEAFEGKMLRFEGVILKDSICARVL